MSSEILQQEPGRYALLKRDDRYYVSVCCGTSAGYLLNIPITGKQAAQMTADPILLDQLVGSVSFAPQRYLSQHVDLSS